MAVDNLSNLLNALTETSVYVIEEQTHKILYFNQRCIDTARGKAAYGAKCHDVWPEVCGNCPLETMGDEPSSHIVCYDPIMKMTVDVTANRILWDECIPAVIVTSTPHRLNSEETQNLQKIERMYAQSLVTVFDESIIANLTADYYVNCQKDLMWSGIPEQGNFGVENRIYAENVVHPDDREQFNSCFSREAMLEYFQGDKKQVSKRLRRLVKDGTYHMVEFTAAIISDFTDGECWCVLVYRDVQDEFLAEQQRNVEISQLATAAQIAYQMLIAVNLTRNTYHMLGYNRSPVHNPGTSGCFVDLMESELSTVHPDYKEEFIGKFSRQSLIDAFTGGERIITMEVPHIGEDGLYHWHFTQVVSVESPYTDDLIEITLSRNIDEDRHMQQQALEKERRAKQLLEDALEKAEKANQSKSDFLSRMSHDIRTPMNAILGLTELAQIDMKDKDKLDDYLSKIHSSGKHLLGLINEVLDVSKIESGKLQLVETDFDLRELVRDTIELVQLDLDRRNQDISVKPGKKFDSKVTGDAQRLKQILVNILDNASKYTKNGGKISFSLDELGRGEPNVGTYRFVIEDNGIGMEEEYLKHIFDPFSRATENDSTKVAGTGLGMTIVKNLVAMMGGDIQVKSQYGKGTQFTVTLCLCKNNTQESRKITENREGNDDFSGLRVLLAEDNEINRKIATEMINLQGATVETAEDGQQAVDAVCSHPPFYYDMIFMDIQMPNLNGYDATIAIRNSGVDKIEELPIIAMTADAFAEDVRHARLSGMNGHLSKPISMDQLKAELSRCLEWKENRAKTQCQPEEK